MFQFTEEHGVLALSLLLAVFSAYSTLELAGRLPRKHRGRRVWCLGTGIVLVAGALAAAQLAKVTFFRFVPYHYSAAFPVILAAVIASWIAPPVTRGGKSGPGQRSPFPDSRRGHSADRLDRRLEWPHVVHQ